MGKRIFKKVDTMRLILLLLLTLSTQLAFAMNTTIFTAKLTTGASSAVRPENFGHTNILFQASGTTSVSTGSATVKLQGSNDGTNWVDIGSISLTLGTAATSDKIATVENWTFIRGNVTAITGTGASINASVNY
jgi:hypothetical protein